MRLCVKSYIRIALLQRQTLNETRNHTLKFLKWHYSTVRPMETVAVLMEDGGFDSSRVFAPGNLPFKAKKVANAQGSARGGGGGGGAGRSWN